MIEEPTDLHQKKLSKEKMRVIEEFTWLLGTMGLSVSVVWRKSHHRWIEPQVAASAPAEGGES